MKQTLLEIVQGILNELDTDDVNSIEDTVEAMQVSHIVKNCYLAMCANRNWPHQRRLTQVQHSGTPDKPTHLKLPENVKELVFFKYDKTKKDSTEDITYQEIHYLYPDEFLRMVSSRNMNTPNTMEVIDNSGVSLVVKTNQAPSYWTSFDDDYIVCDSFDKNVDDALKKSKTQCLLYVSPVWIHRDDAVPDLPSEAFPALVEEAKSTSFLTLKQMANEKAEVKAQKQQRWLARKAWRAHGGIRYDNYGRRSRK